MCTCIAFRQKGLYFGRNMDLDYSFGEKIIITPQRFTIRSSANKNHFGFIGTATVIDGYPLYADAMNEKGLCIAGLNFYEKAYYRNPCQGKTNVPAFDFIAYVAANYSSVEDLCVDLHKINITNEPFSAAIPSPTLHWMVSDAVSSVVVESTASGVILFENPFDAMTNLPEFPEHVKNYARMISEEGSAPDDFPVMLSSPVRFLRIAHFLGNNLPETDAESAITHVFHLLDTVAVPDVSVKAANGNFHKTTYSICLDTIDRCYLIRTYENSQICRVALKKDDVCSSKLSVFDMSHKQGYQDLN